MTVEDLQYGDYYTLHLFKRDFSASISTFSVFTHSKQYKINIHPYSYSEYSKVFQENYLGFFQYIEKDIKGTYTLDFYEALPISKCIINIYSYEKCYKLSSDFQVIIDKYFINKYNKRIKLIS